MGVEDVHVLEAHALQALVETGQQVFARAPLAIRTAPTSISGFGADDQFVAVGGEIFLQDASEILLGRARRWAVIVCKIEMGDAEIERPAQHGAGVLENIDAAEVVPQTERDGGQEYSASSAAPVLHCRVAIRVRCIGH